MIKELSILIPTYNRVCGELVRVLQMQAEEIDGLRYEIVVADDASTDESVVRDNRVIDAWDCCRLIENHTNLGRVGVRNYLALKAQYRYLLFMDSDVAVLSNSFLSEYLKCDAEQVVYGGVEIPHSDALAADNLRYRYERSCVRKFSVERRRRAPYQSFRTTNFLVRRDVMLAHPFDERIAKYGYEDVLFGKELREAEIPIHHIANPVAVDDFEGNEKFLRKTEEGLETLCAMSDDLRGFSQIITCADWLRRFGLAIPLSALFRRFEPTFHRRLTGPAPSVRLFNLYRLGYYLTLCRVQQQTKM